MTFSANPVKKNFKYCIFLKGDENTIGSKRLSIDSETDNPVIEKLIAEDIWQPDSFEFGPDTVWIGPGLGLTSGGHHLFTENPAGGFHSFPHSDFNGRTTQSDTKAVYKFYFSERQIAQEDESNEWVGTEFTWAEKSSLFGFIKKGYWKTGSIAATKPIRTES